MSRTGIFDRVAAHALCCAALFSLGSGAVAGDFTNFESSQVHPVILSADGTKLYAINTPEGRLSVFDVGAGGSLTLSADFAVGVDPVSLASREDEVWVVNHVSDSISVIDVALGKLVATIQTGDEPTDIVFANGRAFVSQSGNRDHVRVYDAVTRAELAQIDIFGDDPRALATSTDGSEVYLVVLESGNGTTSIDSRRDGLGPPPPSPAMSPELPPAPQTALIVKFDPVSQQWEDETGTSRGDLGDLDVPDEDLFVIDTASLEIVRTVRSVGTTLYEVAVQPGTNHVWVANTEARNQIRFEPNVRGHFVDTRLTVVDTSNGDRGHHDLNPHIDYGVSPGPPSEIALSIAIPGDVQFTSDGSTCYVTSFGSAKVAIFDTATGLVGRIAVGGGPTGLALAESIDRLYVLNRFDNTISIVDTESEQEIDRIGVAGPAAFDPSPDVIRNGRRFLYDAVATSGHGDSACASCHVFGNFDGLGWDLGDPTSPFTSYEDVDWIEFTSGPTRRTGFHPMKGPMVTQTLRGLEGNEPFHWRGDRRDFQHFNGAFVSLMGRDEPMSGADMDAFTDFIMTVVMPPNPNRTLDDQLPPTIRVMSPDGYGAFADADPSNGSDLYFNGLDAEGRRNCVTCHAMPVGTDNTLNSSPFEPQDMKISQLRNMYEKVGFGRVYLQQFGNIAAPRQKSGFGVLHAGAGSLAEFLFGYFAGENVTLDDEEDVAAFLMAFPTGTPPVVGHQLTLDYLNARTPSADAEIALMLDQAAAGNCDVVVQGVVESQARSFVYDAQTDAFVPDSRENDPLADAALRSSLVDGDVITYTAVPAGSGIRVGIDRDRDTWRDADELVDGADPADTESAPRACDDESDPAIERARFKIVTPSGEEPGTIHMRGVVDLASHASPPVDLATTGMVVDLRDATGAVILRRWIPPGVLQAHADKGWRFRDDTGAVAGGIERVVVRKSSGRFRFRIEGAGTGASLEGAVFPLTMGVVFGTAEQDATGQCGGAQFEATRCRTSPEVSACR